MKKALLIGLLAIGVGAMDVAPSSSSVDLSSVRAKIKIRDYQSALQELKAIVEHSQQADVYNLLGFTSRKLGDFSNSLIYYEKALELEPEHKAAHEYLGELYLQTGHPDKAREQLAVLAKLCPSGCEERDDLQTAIRQGKNE